MPVSNLRIGPFFPVSNPLGYIWETFEIVKIVAASNLGVLQTWPVATSANKQPLFLQNTNFSPILRSKIFPQDKKSKYVIIGLFTYYASQRAVHILCQPKGGFYCRKLPDLGGERCRFGISELVHSFRSQDLSI